MNKRKGILKIAIDSPAAAGAGTIAKTISRYYNLLYLDTGKIYRIIALNKLKYPKKFNLKFKVGTKRDGDPDILIADNKKSVNKLKWKLEKNSLKAIISSAIKYHKNAI